MKQYIDGLKTIQSEGVYEDARTGVRRQRYHGLHMRFDTSKFLPIITTKKVATRIIIEELLWFLKGRNDLRSLLEKNIHIWTPDAYREYKKRHPEGTYTIESFEDKILSNDLFSERHGDLGPIYGVQWRNRNGIDQIRRAFRLINEDHASSRIIVDAWNPSDLKDMALPPCHYSFQFTRINDTLNVQMNQRSGDMFLGVPFNITSYSILLALFAEVLDLKRGTFTHTITDAHIYETHEDAVNEQVSREVLAPSTTLTFSDKVKNYKYSDDTISDFIDSLTIDDFVLDGYESHGVIKAELSV